MEWRAVPTRRRNGSRLLPRIFYISIGDLWRRFILGQKPATIGSYLSEYNDHPHQKPMVKP